MLVDDGKLHWDDKVIQHLPQFEMYDKYVTEHLTIRDLLTHRCGLPSVAGGTLWYHSNLSRTEIINRMKYLKPATEFRTKTAYQNITYLVAGEIVAKVSGMSWDEFVHKNIFLPLGMNQTITSYAERCNANNIAGAHITTLQNQLIEIEQEKLDNIAAATSIYSTSTDMAKYMNFMLNEGIINGDTIVSPLIVREILKPQIIYPRYKPPIQNQFSAYGFGWWLTLRKGTKVIDHSGGIDGATANVIMIENGKRGIIAFSNSYEKSVFAATYGLLGKMINDAEYMNFAQSFVIERNTKHINDLNQQKKAEFEREKNTVPSLETKYFAGTYFDEMYGEIEVKKMEEQLWIEFEHTPILKAKLAHWQYDTYRIEWTDARIPWGFLTFVIENKQVVAIKLRQPNLLDVDFSELSIQRKKE